ncbi:hypothetical protein ACFFGH_10105 [Lysobacter korlensis]|uniref:Uncharacterized protein n=1 Tax=Lysobacter korlensis TaxID=553636 RepID=A0ABV6RP68_9GAMM
MSSQHAARVGAPRLVRSAHEPWLMRVAFATAGAAVTAGLTGVFALVSWH